MSRKRIVIVGAGIAGLAAAWRAHRIASERGLDIEVLVLEGSSRAGGVIETVQRDDCTMELGPDSIITEKPWAKALCEEIGLGGRIVGTTNRFRQSFVARGRRLHAIPEGFYMMAPSRLSPFARTGLFSWAGKLRMAADLVLPRGPSGVDESLADFVRRRLGREALERAAQPMVGGVYTADPERLSLRATMPRFLEMERQHRSLILALVASRKRAAQAAKASGETGASSAGAASSASARAQASASARAQASASTAAQASASAIAQASEGTAAGPRYSLFISLDQGLAVLPERLVELLPAGTVRTGSMVERIERTDEGWRVFALDDTFDADAVCVATPAWSAARLIEGVSPELTRSLNGIEYASSATVNMVWRRDDIAHPLDGFGFVVPAVEKRTLLACTFSSVKYPGRAPDDRVLVRAFVGGALFPDAFELPDDRLLAGVTRDLGELIGVRGQPRDVVITRWPRSMPQYNVGHLERVARIEDEAGRHPTLALAGAAYRGVGIPDCVRSGEAAGERLVTALAR